MGKLTKRNYLGEGYLHEYRNNETGEIMFVPCTKKEYESLAKNGSPANIEGYTWACSAGGTYKVDTPDTVLGADEYCEIGDIIVVREGAKDTPEVVMSKDKLKDGGIIKEI